jgi:hypothetical protein
MICSLWVPKSHPVSPAIIHVAVKSKKLPDRPYNYMARIVKVPNCRYFTADGLVRFYFVIRIGVDGTSFHLKGVLVAIHHCGESRRPFECDASPNCVIIKSSQIFCPKAEEACL